MKFVSFFNVALASRNTVCSPEQHGAGQLGELCDAELPLPATQSRIGKRAGHVGANCRSRTVGNSVTVGAGILRFGIYCFSQFFWGMGLKDRGVFCFK